MVKVSACIITYNQSSFIEECLIGAINQIVNFDYEIIIGDDCSSDETSSICERYAKNYPSLIKYRRRNNNLGMVSNWLQTISECSGRYIALCEGDDYWTDPYKLQKQIDFLEAHPEYVLCFHPVYELNGVVKKEVTRMPNEPSEYETSRSIAMYGNYIYTPSVVFRNISFTISPHLNKAPAIDWYIYLALAPYGNYGKLPDTMAAYRLNSGVWSQLNNQKRLNQFFITLYLYYRALENQPEIQQILKQRYTSLFRTIIPYLNEQELNDINQLCSDTSELQQMMLAEIKHLHKNQLSNTKILTLLQHVIQRAGRTLFVKLPKRFASI